MTEPASTATARSAVPADTTADALAAFTRRAALAAPTLAVAHPETRRSWLERIADRIEGSRAELREVAAAETALAEDRLDAELDRTVHQLRFLGAEGVRAAAAEVVEQGFLRRTRPIGPVAVYAAGNFPFAFSVAGTDTASALAAGCPVVVKTHPGHPETSAMTAALVGQALSDEASVDGAFAVVNGFDAGVRLVGDPAIRAAAFTGSPSGGRALFDAATRRPDPIPFYGELGSINPVVITSAALRERRAEIAQGFVDSFLLGSGQLCTKPGVVFLPADHEFEGLLRRAIRRRSANRLLTEAIASAFDASLGAATAVAEVVCTGGAGTVLKTDLATFRSAPQLADEMFGPAAVLVEVGRDRDLVDALSSIEGSLTATIHAEHEDAELARRLVTVATRIAGRVVWNGWPTGVAVNRAMHHGGPWPSTTSPLHTSVGAAALDRFRVPVVYQGVPDGLVPAG
ncbi:aldehyde dehydrogenase family protein [Agromyces sp. H66]|uniref:aldehyde dehydrogenase family protein n=1 Tax=Agromyces sp. H66 TaxID=2529859 RepID=UPI0010AB2759|nr:aldehyde dehydrogenase family protein [Agromyces sp. H66]